MVVKLEVFIAETQESLDYILDVDQITDKFVQGPAIQSSNKQADIDYDTEPMTFFWNNPNKDHIVLSMEPI